MNWCLPPALADKFLAAIKGGELAPDRLRDMTSAERRTELAKYVGEENAKQVNTELEQKFLLKDWQAGVINWIKKTGGMNEKTKRDLVMQVQKMEKLLTPDDEKAFLSDLAEKKIGTSVTADEARNIFTLSQKAEDARNAGTENISGVSDEFLNASQELRSYINSLKPVSAARSIGMNAAVIARNNLLFNPSTPIKTTIGQVENTIMEAIVRRVSAKSMSGLNHNLSVAARREAWQTYKNTGMNVASMENIGDKGRLGEGKRFDIEGGLQSANPVIRAVELAFQKTAQISNKIIIDWAHVAPFTKFYQHSFYDMANIVSSTVAKGEGLVGDAARARAEELFRDAGKVVPETPEGAMVRNLSQQQAARVTSTNKTLMSNLAMGVKESLNKAVYGLGDALMPIAKIPANIIWNGIENAGVGLPLGVRDIFLGRQKIQSADLATRYQGMAQYAGGIQKILRTTGTIAGAAYFASLMEPADFRTDRFGQHYIKIGNTWINMEYMSAISPALGGMMTAKAAETPNQSLRDEAGNYAKGALSGLQHAPGINELKDLVDSIAKLGPSGGFAHYASNFYDSRAKPAFYRNIRDGLPEGRVGERLLFGAHGVESTGEVATDKANSKYKSSMHKTFDNMSVWGGPLQDNEDADPVNKASREAGFYPSFPERKILGVQLNEQQYSDYVRQSGRLSHMLIDEVIHQPGWDQMPVAVRLKYLQAKQRVARDLAAKAIKASAMGSDNDISAQASAARFAANRPPVQFVDGEPVSEDQTAQ